MAKRRRYGTVAAPSLDELLPSQESAKKPRLRSGSPSSWSVDEVVEYLHSTGLDESISAAFEAHEICGRHLLHLSSDDLKEIGIQSLGARKEVLSVISSLSKMRVSEREKMFNDPVHGHMDLHPLMVKIIDTPQFQRLRDIKQLGGCYYVFMGASHNRFEHSLGTAYLAGELVELLQSKHPELLITEQDLLCVKIAALCLDLGRGPFSCVWDEYFIPKAHPGTSWKVKDASVMMFNHLIASNCLLPELVKYGLDNTDLTFILEQIAGPLDTESPTQDWPYLGRPKEKSFLYEVVASKRNGFEVDNWDSLGRDCHRLKIHTKFDYQKFMAFARVVEVDGCRQICSRDKEVYNLCQMLHTRDLLHKQAYHHRTSIIINYMLSEALLKADKHLPLHGKDGAPVLMSEAVRDPHTYTRLTDYVVQRILESSAPSLSQSREILRNVQCRQLYQWVGQTTPPSGVHYYKSQSDELAGDIIASLEEPDLGELSPLNPDDLVVDVVTFDRGENAIDHMLFYTKNDPSVPVQVHPDLYSEALPHKSNDQSVRVYCKLLDRSSQKAALMYFQAWCRQLLNVTVRVNNGVPCSLESSVYTTCCSPRRESEDS